MAECIALPALAALPWRLAWSRMRQMARRASYFGDTAERAADIAATHGFVHDRRSWLSEHRLMRIVDQVDPALALLRGNRWMDRHLFVEGDPLPPPPCVAIGFHYGTGFWTLRHLRRAGHRAAFVSARVDATQAPGQPLRLAFMRRKIGWIERAGGAPIIFVGGGTAKIRAALRSGTSILGMVDVPLPSSTNVVELPFLDGVGRFSNGLVRLAAAEGVPIVAYLPKLDPVTGDRRLVLTRLPIDGEDSMHSLVAMLDRAVRDDPAAWHLWVHWPHFMV
ncbi:MAG TPA: hypothetical protein VF925_13260 [Casimicrobiaceae bacterium]